MSAAANMAAMLVALVPAQAGDQAVLSSITDRGTASTATVTAVERGRILPRRIAGWAPWTCRRGAGRNVTCTVSGSTHVLRSVVNYRIRGGYSTTRVHVRVVAR